MKKLSMLVIAITSMGALTACNVGGGGDSISATAKPKSFCCFFFNSSITDEEKSEKLLQKAFSYYENEHYTEAIELFQKAASLGNAEAMYQIGNAYRFGVGKNKFYKEALNWWKKAASLGHTQAMMDVAGLYEFWQIPEYSIIWYEKAANNGNGQAMLKLGDLYFERPIQDHIKAIEWYKKAFESGYTPQVKRIFAIYNSTYNEAAAELYRLLTHNDIYVPVKYETLDSVTKQRFPRDPIALEDYSDDSDVVVTFGKNGVIVGVYNLETFKEYAKLNNFLKDPLTNSPIIFKLPNS